MDIANFRCMINLRENHPCFPFPSFPTCIGEDDEKAERSHMNVTMRSWICTAGSLPKAWPVSMEQRIHGDEGGRNENDMEKAESASEVLPKS